MARTQKKKKKLLGKSLMFPLHGHVNSIAIQNLFNFEIKKMPGHNWEITKKGRATNLESRSDKTSQSDAKFKRPEWVFFVFLLDPTICLNKFNFALRSLVGPRIRW